MVTAVGLLVQELILLLTLALDELEDEFLVGSFIITEPFDSVEVGSILPELFGGI